MKKYLVIGIVFLMLFTLVACNKDTNTTPDSDTQTQAQEPSDNTGPADTAAPTDTLETEPPVTEPVQCQHSFSDWLVTKAASCVEEGQLVRVCEKCAFAEVTAIGKTNVHTETIEPPVAATCTATGFTEGKHCALCGVVLVAPSEVPMTAHTYDNQYDESCNVCGYIRDTDCAHAETETIKGKEATCTTAGLTDGKKCKRCGEILVAQTTINALGHKEVTDKAVAATCTTAGKTEGKHCSACNAVLVKQTTIGALGHKEVTDPAVAATCTAAGKTEGKRCTVCGTVLVKQAVVDALGHKEVTDAAVAPTCTLAGKTEGKHCSVCNVVLVAQSVVPMTSHTYDNANDESCNVCGYIRDVACAHTETETIKGTPATCTDAGLTDGKKCKKCGEILEDQRIIYASGHVEVIDAAVAPTCTAAGKTEGKHCSACDAILIAQTTVNALGHTEVIDRGVDATCTTSGKTDGKHCSVCGTVLVAQTILNAFGHTPVIDPAVAPSCSATGLTEGKHCSVCNTVLVAQTNVPMTDHTYDNDSDETCNVCGAVREVACAHAETETIKGKAATCTESGLTDGKKCKKCGEITVAQTTIGARGHTEVIDKAVAATCTTAGKTEGKHCSVCGTVLVAQTTVNALGHTFGEWKTAKEPTTTEEGLAERTCACGEKETNKLDKIVGELEYKLNDDGKSYTVVGIGTYTAKDLIIPDTYKGLPVTAIGDSAFYACRQFTGDLSIGDNVTTIGDKAFNWCDKFKGSLTIGNSVTLIRCQAFDGCSGFTGDLVIPDSVISIEGWAFSGCKGFNGSLTIGNNVAYIGDSAFSDCSGLTGNLVIPNSVTSLGSAFGDCSGFTGNLVIPNSITSIDNGTFYNCSGFTGSLVIPDGVTSIGNGAFKGCSSLTEVIIPTSVQTIGGNAFYNCISLKKTTIYATNVIFVISVPFGEGVFFHTPVDFIIYGYIGSTVETYANARAHNFVPLKCVGAHPFGEWVTVKEPTTTEEGLAERICPCGEEETREIDKLDEVIGGSEEPSYALDIGGQSYVVTGLGTCHDTIIISSTYRGLPVTRIAMAAFFGCGSITTVTIPDSITIIDVGAFKLCKSLTTINYSGTKAQWNAISVGTNCFDQAGDFVVYCTDGTIPETGHLDATGLAYALDSDGKSYSLIGASSDTKIDVPSTFKGLPVTSIGEGAFRGRMALSEITIGQNIKSIGWYAFLDCRSLERINYKGAVSEWEEITYGVIVDGNNNYIVYCVDGEISKNGVKYYD